MLAHWTGLSHAPPSHTPEFEIWDTERREIEHEVELQLAATRLSVEGLEQAWENWQAF